MRHGFAGTEVHRRYYDLWQAERRRKSRRVMKLAA